MNIRAAQESTTMLSVAERSDLQRLESVVEKGQQTFIDVGNALAAIRDSRLYRETHGTFEAYCRDRWKWGKSQAYQLISAAEVAENVRHGGQTTPTSERQIRPLTSLDKDKAREAWVRAHEIAEEEDSTVTGTVVQRAAREVTNVSEIKRFQPDTPKPVSKAFVYSQEAINWLGKIRPDDHNRDAAMQSVIDWINFNK